MSNELPITQQPVAGVPGAVATQAAPAYLAEAGPVDNSDLDGLTRPPTIKICQAMTKETRVKDACHVGQPYMDTGEVVRISEMIPSPTTPGKMTENCVPFSVIPLFQWKSWAGFILNTDRVFEFSNSPTSRAAIRSKDFGATFSEMDENSVPIEVQYREAINFLFWVESLKLVAHIGFSSSSYKTGSQLAKLIGARRPLCSMVACRMQLFTTPNVAEKGTTPKWGVQNHPTEPWVMDPADFKAFSEMREKARADYESSLRIPDAVPEQARIEATPHAASF